MRKALFVGLLISVLISLPALAQEKLSELVVAKVKMAKEVVVAPDECIAQVLLKKKGLTFNCFDVTLRLTWQDIAYLAQLAESLDDESSN